MSTSRLIDHVAGSPLSITCSISTSLEHVDVEIQFLVNWTRNGQLLTNDSDERIITQSTYIDDFGNFAMSSVAFKTLSSTEDTGTYACSVVTVSNNLLYLENSPPNIQSVNITVTGKPSEIRNCK